MLQDYPGTLLIVSHDRALPRQRRDADTGRGRRRPLVRVRRRIQRLAAGSGASRRPLGAPLEATLRGPPSCAISSVTRSDASSTHCLVKSRRSNTNRVNSRHEWAARRITVWERSKSATIVSAPKRSRNCYYENSRAGRRSKKWTAPHPLLPRRETGIERGTVHIPIVQKVGATCVAPVWNVARFLRTDLDPTIKGCNEHRWAASPGKRCLLSENSYAISVCGAGHGSARPREDSRANGVSGSGHASPCVPRRRRRARSSPGPASPGPAFALAKAA